MTPPHSREPLELRQPSCRFPEASPAGRTDRGKRHARSIPAQGPLSASGQRAGLVNRQQGCPTPKRQHGCRSPRWLRHEVPSLSALAAALLALLASPALLALTPEELELPNRPSDFPGLVEHAGLKGATWVRFPFAENPDSFGFDAAGRLYVAEANRFWLGVPDLRGTTQLIPDDFCTRTVEDRTAG